jgi:hypothetical protein
MTSSTISHEGRSVRVLAVGPKQAKEWLNTVNTRNRNVLPKVVRKYTKAMEEGRWREMVGEPISFAEDGTLLNGQQRLTALVESGTTQIFLVLEGLPLGDQDVMDSGANRKTGQQLTMRGWKNGSQVSAIARVLLQWHTRTILSGTYVPDTDEIVQFAENHRELMDASTVVAMRIRRVVPLLPSVVGAVYFTAKDHADTNPELLSADQVDEFFGRLESGADLSAGNPILTLRNVAAKRQRDGHSVEQPKELYYLIRVWKAWREGETLEKIQLPRLGPITERHITLT